MIQYKRRKKYKYTLLEDFTYDTGIKPDDDIETPLLELHKNGNLKIKAGYAWDGASGPAIDTKTFMCGSLVHDALYQLLREKKLNQSHCLAADKLLREICIECGMNKVRAWWVYHGVRIFGARAAAPDGLEAPSPQGRHLTTLQGMGNVK